MFDRGLTNLTKSALLSVVLPAAAEVGWLFPMHPFPASELQTHTQTLFLDYTGLSQTVLTLPVQTYSLMMGYDRLSCLTATYWLQFLHSKTSGLFAKRNEAHNKNPDSLK